MLHFLEAHEALAAWVQAVGSLFIVAVTAIIAGWQTLEARRRERQAIYELKSLLVFSAEGCMRALDDLLKNWRFKNHSDGLGDFLRAYSPHDFQIPMDYMAAVPLQNIGDSELAKIVMDFRAIMSAIKMKLDSAKGDVYHVTSASTSAVAREPEYSIYTLAFCDRSSALKQSSALARSRGALERSLTHQQVVYDPRHCFNLAGVIDPSDSCGRSHRRVYAASLSQTEAGVGPV